MFTGLIEQRGQLTSRIPNQEGASLSIALSKGWGIHDPISKGESISVNGVCLTVTETDQGSFKVDVLRETLACTNLGDLAPGSLVNLERAMRANARFGGHMVSGHVDGTGRVVEIEELGRDYRVRVACASGLLAGMVHKGSIAMDGISLTLAKVDATGFDVYIIPVTWRETNIEFLRVGESVNLETDMLGKYIQKALQRDRTDA